MPLLALTTANADTPAEALFREGRKAMEAGEVDRACSLFAESLAAETTVGTLVNLGLCEERRERYAESSVYYRAALKEMDRTAVAPSDERYVFAKRHAEDVERKALRAGERKRPATPGASSAPAERPPGIAPPSGSAAPTGTVAPPEPPRRPPPGPAFHVAGALGVTGLTMGIVSGAIAVEAAGVLDDHGCLDDDTCTGDLREAQDAASRGRTASVLSTIGFVVGGTGIALAAVLYVVRPDADADKKAGGARGAGGTIAIEASPRGVAVRGSF